MVLGCAATGDGETAFSIRFRLCKAHMAADSVVVKGHEEPQRFCQKVWERARVGASGQMPATPEPRRQCTTLHPLDAFEQHQKSCRISLVRGGRALLGEGGSPRAKPAVASRAPAPGAAPGAAPRAGGEEAAREGGGVGGGCDARGRGGGQRRRGRGGATRVSCRDRRAGRPRVGHRR